MPEAKEKKLRLQASLLERRLIHIFLEFEKENGVCPSVNDICKIVKSRNFATDQPNYIGTALLRMNKKGFIIRGEKKGIYSVDYSAIGRASLAFMFDVDGAIEYEVQYGNGKAKTFYARNMWEVARFATAIGDPVMMNIKPS